MYKASKTRVKARYGLTQYFNIDVGLHLGSALSPLLFYYYDGRASQQYSKRPTMGNDLCWRSSAM